MKVFVKNRTEYLELITCIDLNLIGKYNVDMLK